MRDTFRARRLGTSEAEFPKILSIGIVHLDPRLRLLATAAMGQGTRQTLDVTRIGLWCRYSSPND